MTLSKEVFKMTFSDRLKEARIAIGLTQEQVADKLGVAKSTLAGYEKGNREPSIPTVQKIMEVLAVDANYLYQDNSVPTIQNSLSLHEIDHLKKYRSLDDYGKKAVDALVDIEYERRSEPKEYIQLLPPIVIPSYGHIASAGTGQYIFDDIPPMMIEIENTMENQEVSFAIDVNGDSMEPTYHDEDTLLVKKQSTLNVGEIGIFMINGEAYVKELGNGVLISHNKDYKDIPLTEDTICIGKVVGKK